jgi:hypothetical protein
MLSRGVAETRLDSAAAASSRIAVIPFIDTHDLPGY